MSEASARVLEAARTLFLEGGGAAVTMRSVAERVGVTATALYRHFESKEALLEAVVGSGFETFGAYLYRALGGETPQERLRQSGEAYLRFALEQPQMYRTIFMTPRAAGATAAARHAPSTFRFLVDRVRECSAVGILKPGPPEEVALTIWAHVHGLVSLHITQATGQSDAEFVATYAASVDRLFTGLLS